MIRAAFLKRMAFAALATALFGVRVPEVESEPDTEVGCGMSHYGGPLVNLEDGTITAAMDTAGNGQVAVAYGGELYEWDPYSATGRGRRLA